MKTARMLTSIFLVMALVALSGSGPGAVYGAVLAAEKPSASSTLSAKLDDKFHNAITRLEKKDYAGAASDLRNAEVLLSEETAGAKGGVKTSLLEADEQLKVLADELGKGVVVSTERMREVFSQTHRALANYQEANASGLWAKKAAAEAGEAFNSAADHLEKAWTWSGRKIEAETNNAIKSARELEERISAGATYTSNEVAKVIEDLQTEISKIGHGSSKEPKQALKVLPIQPPESMVPRINLTTAIIRVAESTIPAVVQIEVSERIDVPNPFLPFEGSPSFRRHFNLPKKMPKKFKEELMGLGSGVIVNPEGYILTNNHVVQGATETKVVLSNGDEYPAKLVGTDPKTDLGVIKIDAGKPLPYVNFGDSSQVVVGQWVVAVGHPRGLDQTVTQGIISAKHRSEVTNPSSYQDFLQTDAAINPGNSGGPLLTLDGLVIGINSAIATQSGGFEGIGFAIPSNMAVHIANDLIATGKVQRGWLGVSIQELTPDLAKSFGLATPKGALIADVMKGGPADRAGLKRGDVVLKYRGDEVYDAADLRNKIADTPVGQEATVVVWRDKKDVTLTVKIGNLDELIQKLSAVVKERLGIMVSPVTEEEAHKYGLRAPEGVSISWVDPKGPFGKVGFEKGDLVLGINNQPVEGVDSFVNMVSSLPAQGKVVLLAVDHRTGQASYVQLELKRG